MRNVSVVKEHVDVLRQQRAWLVQELGMSRLPRQQAIPAFVMVLCWDAVPLHSD